MARTLAVLGGATAAIAAVGEIVSGTVGPFGATLGLSDLFIGVVILPLAGAISRRSSFASAWRVTIK